ncbi:MAG: hypothetical protein ACTTHG_01470 [Treponemataceae bacterium]
MALDENKTNLDEYGVWVKNGPVTLESEDSFIDAINTTNFSQQDNLEQDFSKIEQEVSKIEQFFPEAKQSNTETEQVELTDFISEDSTEVDLNEFMSDDSVEIDLNSFMSQGDSDEDKEETYLEEDPLDIELEFDDNYVEETQKSPSQDIFSAEFDSTSDGFIDASDFFDIEDNGNETDKKEKMQNADNSFNDVSDFDDLLCEFSKNDKNQEIDPEYEAIKNEKKEKLNEKSLDKVETGENPTDEEVDFQQDFYFIREGEENNQHKNKKEQKVEINLQEKEKALEKARTLSFEKVDFNFMEDSQDKNIIETQKSESCVSEQPKLNSDIQENDMSTFDDFSTEKLDENLSTQSSITDFSKENLEQENQTVTNSDELGDFDFSFKEDENSSIGTESVESEQKDDSDLPDFSETFENKTSNGDDFSIFESDSPVFEQSSMEDEFADSSIDKIAGFHDAEDSIFDADEKDFSDETLQDNTVVEENQEKTEQNSEIVINNSFEEPELKDIIANDPVEESLNFEEPTFDDIENEESSVESGSINSEEFEKLTGEVQLLKQELAELKAEFYSFKSSLNVDASPKQEIEPTTETKETSSGFFDDDEDETIALSGDELNNILNNADFTTENGNEISEETDFSENTENEFVEPDLEEKAEEEITLNESESVEQDFLQDTEDNSDFANVELSEPDLENFEPSTFEIESQEEENEIEQEIDIPVDEDITVAADTNDFIESIDKEDPSIDETLTKDKLDFLDDDMAVDGEEISTQQDSQENEQINDTEEQEVDVEDQLDEPTAQMFDSDQWDDSVKNDIEPEKNDESNDYTNIENNPENNGEAASVSLTDKIKSVLKYMDQLLENLPEDKIEEFAKSEKFKEYKSVFEELGI